MPPLIPHLLLIWLSVQRPAWCAERASARERFKVVIAPLICKRICLKGQCQDTCEQGNNTTLIAENGQRADTLTGQGFRVVVCPLTCMNGGVCSSRKHCLCPAGFTGRLCQFPLHQMQQAQAARGNKQPVRAPSSRSPCPRWGTTRPMVRAAHRSIFPALVCGALNSFRCASFPPFSAQFEVRVHHTPDTSVVIQPLDSSDMKPPRKIGQRPVPPSHKPKGRCFQETTPKQACNSTPLPVLTNQEDCCGSVGNSWGQNKCYQCPKLPNASVKQTIVEDYGSTCPQGYKRFNSTHCQDINECSLQGVCQNGDCLNTLGSFRCSCKSGFVLERNRCVEPPAELAQCFLMASESRGCEHPLPTHLTQKMCCCTVGIAWGRNCESCPQEGTVAFSQICPAGKGYFLKHIRETVAFPPIFFPSKPDKEGERFNALPADFYRFCEFVCLTFCYSALGFLLETDTDECRLNICGHGECENSVNGHICHCHPGYHLNRQRNVCEDDNECASEPCGHGRGQCVNTDGGYKCECRSGYKDTVQLGRRVSKCIDVNECSKQDICGAGGHCVNLPGSYKCECHSGFRSKSHRHPIPVLFFYPSIPDINECLNPNTCPNEQCENTPGSYECVPCLPGHEARAGTCYDINECQKPGICPNGRCENLPGTYRCLCNEGFLPSADSKGCSDIDECEDVRLCAYGRCINTDGSFKCHCYPGYQRTQEGSHCEDINECERPSNCVKGRCINNMGSYHCECQKGFTLVRGRECQDIDECATDRSLCQPFGSCENRAGSYVCVCNHGYVLSEDKHSCEVLTDEKKECYLNLDDTVFCDSVLATNVTKQECCCSIGVGWGDHCEIYPCPVSHSAEFHFLCPNGEGLYYDEGIAYSLPAYLDIDECSLFADEICKKGRCQNTFPGYECYCQQGFYYDSNLLECIDVNECQDPSYCKNGRCENTPGSFHCFCDPPLTFSAAFGLPQHLPLMLLSDVCFLQVDEGLICSEPRNGIVVTYSECCCHYGRGWGPECNTCPPRNSGELHLNRISIYAPSFFSLFFLTELLFCSLEFRDVQPSEEDSDECSCANGRCVRSYLGIMCECNAGFRLDHSRTRCIDIDECGEPGVRVSPCKNARCVNTAGSYKCFCKHGFVATRRPNVCARRRTR
uniref:Latent transforming growth factor beta binding protein 3 n=1 Tax=Salarias fasciatus TaxID=181472 RepID=A0A672G603_SALFA